MIEHQLRPRFNDTDCLGHVNNASLATWFEEGRTGFFRMFNPTLSPQSWNLIVARTEIDYLAQGHYEHEVTITSSIERIGTSSFTIAQECQQRGQVIARGKAFLVHFDYGTNASAPIPGEVRVRLSEHLNPPPGLKGGST